MIKFETHRDYLEGTLVLTVKIPIKDLVDLDPTKGVDSPTSAVELLTFLLNQTTKNLKENKNG
jgi:hypothetical protein